MTNTAVDVVGCPRLDVKNVIQPGSSVKVCPNPFDGQITIDADPLIWKSYSVSNIVGNEVVTGNITMSSTKLDLTTMPKGIYFVTTTSHDGSRQTIRMLKD